MNSHTTGWLNPLIDKKAEEILLNLFQDINEVKISDGELLKGLIHFLVNNRFFQYGFRYSYDAIGGRSRGTKITENQYVLSKRVGDIRSKML